MKPKNTMDIINRAYTIQNLLSEVIKLEDQIATGKLAEKELIEVNKELDQVLYDDKDNRRNEAIDKLTNFLSSKQFDGKWDVMIMLELIKTL